MERKILVFATGNPNKIRELKEILTNQFEIRSLKDIGCEEDIPETADTFRGNALQKAEYVKKKYGFDCIAEDSGLEIDALGGAPGVFSARYAGPNRDNEANTQKVLAEMAEKTDRSARYRSAIALIMNGETRFFEGKVEGDILTAKTGNGGFGYDPIFCPKGHQVSFAEMTGEEKNAISHRGEAVKKMAEFFNNKNS